MDSFFQDVRHGIRLLWRAPGFTVVAALTLALGIGANTAVFSIVKSIVYMFPPVPQASKIVRVWGRNVTTDMPRMQMSVPDFEGLRQQSRTFSGLAAWTTKSWLLDFGKGPVRVTGAVVSADFFNVLGVKPAMGRTFSTNDDHRGAPLTAVISQQLWTDAFNRDAGVLGKSITIEGASYTIVGVMPPRFWYQLSGVGVWVPLVPPATGWKRAERAYSVFGRLQRGVSEKEAEAELSLIGQRLEREYPESNTGWTFVPVSLWVEQMKRVGVSVLFLFAPVIFVLLISCANVGNMLLARASVRQAEMAVRAALGAARGRLVRQLLTECMLLSLMGAVLGWALAGIGLKIFLAMLPPSSGEVRDYLRLDWTMFAFALGIAVVTAVLFGLSPALAATKFDLNASLKERENAAGVSRKKQLSRDRLIAFEVGLAVVFLVVTGALVRGIARIQHTASEPGYETTRLLVFRTMPAEAQYKSAEQVAGYYRDLRQRLAAIPGVESVGAAATLPLVGRTRPLARVTMDPPPNDAKPTAIMVPITPGFFESAQIPVLRGRVFSEQDSRNALPVACVNETFARRYWPNEDVVGKRLKMGAADSAWLTVTCLVRDVLDNPVRSTRLPYVYVPHAQMPERTMMFGVRPAVAPASVVAAIRKTVWDFDRSQELDDMQTVEQILDDVFRGSWSVVSITGAFAVMGLLLAAIGVYGIMSFLTAQRTREVGVRLALGASPQQILEQILRRGAVRIAAGTACGLGFAFLLLFLFVRERVTDDAAIVHPYDLLPYAVAAAAIVAAALVGTYIPARRAAHVDPMVALRHE